MAKHATSIPVPITARPLSVWRIRGQMDYAKAATIAVVSDERVDALFDIEADLWLMLERAPINGPADARGKLGAVLQDLTDREEIDDLNANIMRQVMRFLDEQVAS